VSSLQTQRDLERIFPALRRSDSSRASRQRSIILISISEARFKSIPSYARGTRHLGSRRLGEFRARKCAGTQIKRERERERETVHLIRVRDGTVNYPGDSSLTRRKRRASSTTRTGRPERWIRITNDAGKKGRSPSAAEPHGYYSAYRGRRATFIKPCAIRGKWIVLSGRRIQSANAWHSADVNRAKVK